VGLTASNGQRQVLGISSWPWPLGLGRCSHRIDDRPGHFSRTEPGGTQRGSVTWALTALVGGMIVLLATFCYAELGAALPHTGDEYVYLERGLGSQWGFLFGWSSALLQGPATAAWISAGLLRISAFLFPAVSVPIFTWSIPDPFHTQPYYFTFTYAQVWSALAIAGVAAVNYFGVRTAGYAQILLTGLKVAAIIFIVALGFLFKNVCGTQTSANNAALG
jgi:solute carrier family 7 (D/L-type amino acid transporter), member 10